MESSGSIYDWKRSVHGAIQGSAPKGR